MSKFFNEHLELLVISALVKNVAIYPIVGDILEKDSFEWRPFRVLFSCIKNIVENDLIPDYVTICSELERTDSLNKIHIMSNGKRGMEALEYMKTVDVDIDSVEGYAYQVQDLCGSRKLIALADSIRTSVETKNERPISVLGMIDIETGKISAFVGSASNSFRVSNDVVSSSLDRFREASSGKVLFIPTKIKAWDNYTNGLYPQRLYMISAASNDGKSALADNILCNISVDEEDDKKRKGLIVTLEMSAEERVNRLAQVLTGISPLRMEKGELTADELPLYGEAMKKISEAPVIFDDSTELPLPLLRTKLRKFQASGGEYAIIDQLEQLQIGGSADSQPDYIRFNYITYRLKAFARELNIPIIIIHQMNRSADSGQNRGKNVDPQIQDLAQAGEKACDAILMIRHVREGQEVKETSFHWVKNRQGRRGKELVEFVGKSVKFKDIPLEKKTDMPLFAQEQTNA